MTSRDFCYWLMGSLELNDALVTKGLSDSQVAVIKKHLQLVFVHEIDPSIDKGNPETKAVLDKVHGKDTVMRC